MDVFISGWSLILVLGVCTCIYLWWKDVRWRWHYPPSLPSVPFLGSTPWISTLSKVRRNFHIQLTKLSESYGPVFACRLRSYTVVVNGYDAIKEALFCKGHTFADRLLVDPKLSYVNPRGLGIIMGQYSDNWKHQRIFCHQMLRRCGFGKPEHEPRITWEVRCLLDSFQKMEGKPFETKSHLVCSVANGLCLLICGKRFDHSDEEFGSFLNKISEFLKALVDMPYGIHSPFLQWLPEVKRAKKRMLDTHQEMLSFCRKQIHECLRSNASENASSLIDGYLREIEGNNERDYLSMEQLNHVIVDLFIAGAETTSTTLQWAMLYMANNPDIQQKVHDELDSVVEEGGTPSFRHRQKLQYVQAVLTEVQRISHIVPQVGHKTTEDVELRGFNIHKGTDVILNFHSVLMNPVQWPNPEVFDPNRFYKEGKFVKDAHWIPFGLGPRLCMGKQFATQGMFLFFSNILHRFTIMCPEGEDLVNDDTKIQATREPSPFMIRAIPR